jgi:hypothetical protein
MKRIVILLLFSSRLAFVEAQVVHLPVDSVVDRPRQWMHSVRLDAWGDQAANTINNELLFGLYRGGYLQRELRQRNLDAMKDQNRFGYDIGARFTAIGEDSLFGGSKWRPMVSIGHRDVLGTRFSRDVFSWAFFGNADFEDRMAELGNSAHVGMRYQSLGIGIAARDGLSFLRVDLVNGQSFSASDLRVADVTTATDGRLITADLLGYYWSSDTAGNALGRTLGLGVALNGCWTAHLTSGTTPVELAVEVQDLGFIQWNDRSVRLQRDTLINFSGLVVDDLFDLDGILSSGDQLLDTFGLRYTTGSFRSLLPFRLAFSTWLTFPNGWHAGVLLQQVNLPGFVPQFSALGSKRLGERTLFGGELTFGGFGGVRFGAAVRRRFGEKVWGSIGSTHIPGFVLGQTRGLGLQAGIAFGF